MRLLIVLACLVLLVTGSLDLRAQEDVVLYQGAGDVIPISNYSRLALEGIAGKVTVRGGKAGELRFMCRALDDRTAERELTVLASGRTLTVTATNPETAGNLLLEIAVPAGVNVDLELVDSELHASNLSGSLKIKGSRLDIDGRALKNSVDLELDEGTINLQGIEGDLLVDASDVELKVWQLTGQLSLALERSSADVGQVTGAADIDIDGSTLTMNGVEGLVRARGRDGKLHLGEIKRGAIVTISGVRLSLSKTRGAIEVNTDAEVAFNEHKGNLRVEGYGAGLRGNALTGTLFVSSSDATIMATDVGGAVTVQGEELQIELSQLKSTLKLELASSALTVDGVEGTVGVKSEFGDMLIHGTAKALEINSREDMITVSGQKGPFMIRANGPRVSVHIAERTHEEDCMVENKGGDVFLLLSPDVGIRVEAAADYGRIESSFEDVIVEDSETRAAGSVNEAELPAIRLVSGGNVYITPGELPGPND